MFRISAQSFQQKLLRYGIIPSICLSAVGHSPLYAADDSPKKGSLVILEGRQQGKIPEGSNLQQKVQSLTALTNEQADRIKALREEIQGLKNKLHLTQLTVVSEEKGNFKQLYTALKQESAQNKDTQSQLEKIILQLKTENEQEHLKNEEAESRILSLTTALETQIQALNKIEENYKQELSNLESSTHEAGQYKQLHGVLEKELAQYKETQAQLEMLVQQLNAENETEKEKIAEAETHIGALTAVLKEQMLSFENIQKDYKSQLEQLSTSSEEQNRYKILYASMEQELAQNKEAQNQLEQFIQQLKQENENEGQKIAEAQHQIHSLMDALDIQAISHIVQQDDHQKQLASSTNEVQSYKFLNAALEHELTQTKEAHLQIELLIKELQDENHADKLELNESESYLSSLMHALEAQTIPLEAMQEASVEPAADGSDESKKYREISSLLEQELIQTKMAHNQLEELVQQLKNENASDQHKIKEAEANITSMMLALEAQTIPLKAMQEASIEPVADGSDESKKYQQTNSLLEQELAQTKTAQNQLEQLVQQLKNENESDQHKIQEAEAHITSLMHALDIQTSTLENIETTYNAQISALELEDQQKILSQQHEKISSYEEELKKYKEILSQLQEQLALQEKTLNARNEDLNSMQAASGNSHDETWNDRKTEAELIEMYKALEEENVLALSAGRTHSHLLAALERDLQVALESLNALQQDHDEKIQQIAYLQELNANQNSNVWNTKQLTALYNEWEAEKGMVQSFASHATEDKTLRQLTDVLETLQLQQAVAAQGHLENDEKVQQLLSEVNDERAKANAIQKNLDEIQQIYDQTVKLYNEMYVDHKTAQKQLEALQRELDERKMNHLVENDGLEVRLGNLTQEFKKEQEQAQELQMQLSTALAEAEQVRNLKQEHHQLVQDSDDIKKTYISHIETLSLHEHLLKQTLAELDHQKKIIEDQAQILQQVYEDKQSLAVQLQAIPFTSEEIQQLQASHEQLKNELENSKSTQLQHLQADALQEDLINLAQVELEKYKSTAGEKENAIQQLLHEKESQQNMLAEKNEEIRRLNIQIGQTEEQIKLQFKEFAVNLEQEKCKNYELQKELTEHNMVFHAKQQNMQVINQELEKLKNDLALKDEDYLLQKIEMEDLSDRLKQINAEKSKLMLHMQMLEEKPDDPISQASDEHQRAQQENDEIVSKLSQTQEALESLKQQHEQEIAELLNKQKGTEGLLEKSQLTQEENQKLVQEMNALKQEMDKYKERDAKITSVQLERLQEALQQMIIEKTTLQSIKISSSPKDC